MAVGVALTTATQLRVGAIVGLGEVMLFVWMLVVGIRALRFGAYGLTPLTQVFLWFWMASLMALTLGILIAESKGITSEGVYHDGIAFLFAFIFCLCFSASIISQKSINTLVIINTSFTTISLFVLFWIRVPFLVTWFDGARFEGWANNPNQAALLISMLPFLNLHLLVNQRRKERRKIIGYILLILGSLIVGAGTDSDALKMGWFIGFSITLFGFVYKNIMRYASLEKITSTQKRKLYKIIIEIILFLTTIIVIFSIYYEVNSAATHLYNRGGHGSDRMILWKHGIAAISSSPLFGLGPGAHSGVKEPFLDFESHNTFIDWGASSGIIGIIAYISLLGWVGWKAWRSGSIVLVAAVISIAGFSSFHYVLRHIIFWFYLLSIASLSTNTLKDRNLLSHSTRQITN